MENPVINLRAVVVVRCEVRDLLAMQFHNVMGKARGLRCEILCISTVVLQARSNESNEDVEPKR
jgi:hypothetical protein